MVKAHRWTYERFIAPVPDGMYVCHTCDNPPCVNPSHLFLGDQFANMQDMTAKGRGSVWAHVMPERRHPGESNGSASLTESQVLAIRDRYAAGGISQQALADECGVHQTAVSAIIRRKTWTHI
jgi:hypothetical protein